MNTRRKNETVKLLDGQKIIADTVSAPLSKDEIELLIVGLCALSIVNRRTFNVYQKLTGKLEALENDNDAR